MKKIVFLINTLDSGGVVSLLLEKYDCYLILIHNNIFYKFKWSYKTEWFKEINKSNSINIQVN